MMSQSPRTRALAGGLPLLVIIALAAALFLGPAPAARAATFDVTRNDDPAPDGCNVGDCSLREAIIAANAAAGPDTINLPPDTYTLTITGANENAAATGDLDITGSLTIVVTGGGTAVIQGGAGWDDRILDVDPGTVGVTVSISNVILQGGVGSTGVGGGGILNNTTSTLTLTNVTVRNNAASGFLSVGGGIANLGTLTLNNSTVSGNTATANGGGIYTNVGTLTATNSTISGNSAALDGGGVNSDGGTVNLNSVTIAANSTAADGGGVNASVSFNFGNTIIGGNFDTGDGSHPDCKGTLVSQDFNLIQNATTCSIVFQTGNNITGQSPNLGPLANNGGPTQTHALLAGSPAIDAGDTANCPATDQRGVGRPLDGDGDGTADCDIGAYEAPATPTPTPTNTPTPTFTSTSPPGATATNTPTNTATSPPGVPTSTFTPTSIAPPPPTSPPGPGPGPGPFSTPVGGQGVGSGGGLFNCDPWKVTVPPGTVPDGSTVHCGAFDPNFAPPAPGGFRLLRRTINIHIYNPQGSWITTFASPLAFCYRYTDADVTLAGGSAHHLVVQTAPISGTWSALTTTVTTSTRQACAQTSHLTLFDVSARLSSATAPFTYVVRPGDNLFRIALRFGTTVRAIQIANGLRSWLIYAGQTLIIPGRIAPAPTTSPPTAGAPIPGPATTYVVQPGDTLFRLALRFGTTVSALQAANGLRGNLIYAGQTLVIPGGSAAPTAAPATSAPPAPGVQTYIVRTGDTLFSLALRFGTTVRAIQAANGLISDRINVGQVLIIPTGGAAIGATQPPAPDALARPNGALIHAPRRSTAPNIDGDLGEWNLSGSIPHVVYGSSNWTGGDDLGGSFAVAWDAAYLYLAVRVVDDVYAQTQRGPSLFKGDSLEVLLDADLGGDFASTVLNADDHQLGLSPGLRVGENPEAYLWFPAARAGPPPGIILAARAVERGYQVEAAIPWSVFNLTPTGGARYGFALSISDNDSPGSAEQQSMISTAPTRLLANPASWGTLVLDH